MAQDNLYNAQLLKDHPGKYKVIPGDFSHEDIAIGLPAGDFDWWRVLNTWVKQFNASGDNAPPVQALVRLRDAAALGASAAGRAFARPARSAPGAATSLRRASGLIGARCRRRCGRRSRSLPSPSASAAARARRRMVRRHGARGFSSRRAAYVEFMRNTPLIVLLFLVYFGLPQTGLRLGGYSSALIG